MSRRVMDGERTPASRRAATRPGAASRGGAASRRGAAALTMAAALLAAALLAGCQVQPWVKPYEREHLADPIMSFDRDPIASGYLEHVFEVREGARGASGSVGGGCGCN